LAFFQSLFALFRSSATLLLRAQIGIAIAILPEQPRLWSSEYRNPSSFLSSFFEPLQNKHRANADHRTHMVRI
jgi:hypothetical protein